MVAFLSIASFLLASSSTEALCPLGVTTKKSPLHFVPLTNNNQANEGFVVAKEPGRRDFLAKLAIGFTAAVAGGMGVGASSPAGAAVLTSTTTASSSTGGTVMLLAEETIKTLDLSLPSYDSINTLKSNSETAKGLGVENPTSSNDPTAAAVVVAAPRKKKSSSVGSSGGGSFNSNPLSNVLPSMNKMSGDKKPQSSSTTTTTRTTRTNERRVQEEKNQDEVKTMDLSLPSYSEGVQSKERSIFAL
jgi:hypothetical protein